MEALPEGERRVPRMNWLPPHSNYHQKAISLATNHTPKPNLLLESPMRRGPTICDNPGATLDQNGSWSGNRIDPRPAR